MCRFEKTFFAGSIHKLCDFTNFNGVEEKSTNLKFGRLAQLFLERIKIVQVYGFTKQIPLFKLEGKTDREVNQIPSVDPDSLNGNRHYQKGN